MNSVLFNVGNNSYELKLTTRAVIKVEKAIGKNPIQMFINDKGGARIPTYFEVANIIFYSSQEKMTLENVYDLIDCYIEEDGTYNDLVSLVVDLLRESGILPTDAE